MYTITNDIQYEAVLIAIGVILYPYASPEARKMYDNMPKEERDFYREYCKTHANKGA